MLWIPNSIEWCVVNLAIAKIGAVTVTCNCQPGEEGEVCVKGPSLMLGY